MNYKDYQRSSVARGPKKTRYARIAAARATDLAAEIAALIAAGFVQVDGHPDYLVNQIGEVYSSADKRIVKLRPGTKARGYKYVGLRGLEGTKYKMIHRLVAFAFLPNPRNLPEVNHIDGNKANNCVTNLEWVTEDENKRHAQSMGLYKRGPRKIDQDTVAIIKAASGTYRTIGRQHGVSAQTVCNIKLARGAYSVNESKLGE